MAVVAGGGGRHYCIERGWVFGCVAARLVSAGVLVAVTVLPLPDWPATCLMGCRILYRLVAVSSTNQQAHITTPHNTQNSRVSLTAVALLPVLVSLQGSAADRPLCLSQRFPFTAGSCEAVSQQGLLRPIPSLSDHDLISVRSSRSVRCG